MKILRILGKKGRITIPYEIRQRVGFRYNDVLSFSETPDGRTIKKSVKSCAYAIRMETPSRKRTMR